MKIDNVNIYKNIGSTPKVTNADIKTNQQDTSASSPAKTDRLELSSVAKNKIQESTSKNLAEIKKRVDSGFYNSDEVLKKVAGLLLKEIQGE